MKASRAFTVKEGYSVTTLDGERLGAGASVRVRLASIPRHEYLKAMDWIGSNEYKLQEVDEVEEVVVAPAQTYATRDMSAAPAPAPAPAPEPEPEVEPEAEEEL